MDDKKIKHLEMIQAVITRMASNSFKLKGWTVTLAAGILALASKDTDKLYFIIAYIPVVVFWALDSYYLQQERLYRALYNRVRKLKEGEIDFSLAATKKQFNDKKNSFVSSFISKTELGFYFPLAIVCTIVILITVL